MTYIDYMNYFWRMDEALGFSAVETRLFFKLLDIGNKLHWREKHLRIPMKKLLLTLNCSRNTILKARNRLCECGLISVESGLGNKQAACYQIICDFHTPSRNKQSEDFALRPCDEPTHEQSHEQQFDPNLDPNHERTHDHTYNPTRHHTHDFDATENEPHHTHDHTTEQTSEQTSEQKPDQTPDPYIRRDKDKDTDQKRVLINDPGEEFSHETILEFFHQNCPRLKKVRRLTPFLRQKLDERTKDFKTPGDWERYFQRVAQSDFLCGKNQYNWQADFKWLIKNDEIPEKVLTGQYDNYHKKEDPWHEFYYGKKDGFDFVRGIYPSEEPETTFTSDNHLVDAWAG